jgi:GR25 family glycosyltransferase involved in LPS biosynthesis
MKAYVIGLSRIPSSNSSAQRVVNDLKKFGLDAEFFEGTYGDNVTDVFTKENRVLYHTSFKGNPVDDEYRAACMRPGVMGCFHSHYRLWQQCVKQNQPILIFEDDVIFERGFIPVEWHDVLLLATGKEVYTHEFYASKLYTPTGDPRAGKFKGKVMPGAVGYGLTPGGANKLVSFYKNTFLPADNAMNIRVVNLQCHTYLMGRADTNKKSLTKTNHWVT